MARSVGKGPFVDRSVLMLSNTVESTGKGMPKGMIKIHSRRSTILPLHVGMTVQIPQGCRDITVTIEEAMVGQRFGAFAPTRVSAVFPEKKKKGAR